MEQGPAQVQQILLPLLHGPQPVWRLARRSKISISSADGTGFGSAAGAARARVAMVAKMIVVNFILIWWNVGWLSLRIGLAGECSFVDWSSMLDDMLLMRIIESRIDGRQQGIYSSQAMSLPVVCCSPSLEVVFQWIRLCKMAQRV